MIEAGIFNESDGPNKSERAYRDLRDAILTFELRGGQAIPERMLETELGASRTSIRTALGRLERDGLIRRDGRRSIVTEIEPDEIEQAHDLLITIETAALRQIRPALQATGLAAMTAAIDQVDDTVGAFIQATLNFHTALVGLAGNAFYERASQDAQTRLTRAAWLTRWLARDARHDWERQRRIVASITATDIDVAVADLLSVLTESREAMTTLARDQRTGLLAQGVGIGKVAQI